MVYILSTAFISLTFDITQYGSDNGLGKITLSAYKTRIIK